VLNALPVTALLEETQKYIEADDPLAVTVPLSVAPEELTLVAADVVTDGALAGIKLKTFP
jgi:hypothetical protein